MPSGQGVLPPVCLDDDTITLLGLSDEQVSAITAIHEDLRTAIAQVEEEAQAAFEALLTDEQLQQLDELTAPPPQDVGSQGPGEPPGPPPQDGGSQGSGEPPGPPPQ